MTQFAHLHCHSHYSLLDGASHIDKMMAKVAADGQKAVALTDHGNMFGAFEFVNEAQKHNVKAIVGCEFYLVQDRHKSSFKRAAGERDVRYHQLLLAKNAKGYQNLCRLCSLGFIEGLYSKFPRIDKELITRYHEGLIATSCCYGAEIPQAIVKGDLAKAEELIRWWIDLLGEDFYIEIQRHDGMESRPNNDITVSQEEVNQTLVAFAKKYNLKIIATNDAHYVDREDANPHDIILCVNTNSLVTDTNRFKFSSDDYYMKTQKEMSELFHDIPVALDNTLEIADKVENLKLERELLLPAFPLPEGFEEQNVYLRHLVIQGSRQRYGEITQKIMERIDLELKIIQDMGYPGYFLIVQDFVKAARELGVRVGPGRGSAAGSVVAYALRITDIDPIKYNLLFERFLNPERVSMPDIDIDFDDDGRQKVIDWVVDKYGKSQVAQIITFGTMAARSSIRDVARVRDVDLNTSDRLAKLVPSRPGMKLRKILTQEIKDLSSQFNQEELDNIRALQEKLKSKDTEGQILELALKVEGTVRNTGIHAAGLIIAPDDITKYMPVSQPKGSELYATQYDGGFVERGGMLKMDFLGLTTLSIINDAVKLIKLGHPEHQGFEIDDISLEDPKTMELFQRAETVGIFQFESNGMRRFMSELRPTTIEDLIALNALFRPGPMDYIPSFIRRKHGQEKVQYPHEWLEEILKPTYGIMVYQEQIMQAAQIMADFSLGSADILRRAMGKKKVKEMDLQRAKFVEGAQKKGVNPDQSNEIFDIMAKFAGYGFNRSHAAAYSVLAFQTAYLKAHFPAEFMASVMTHNKGDSASLSSLIREARRMNIEVLGPDINRSQRIFSVDDQGRVLFGLSSLKGVGQGPVEAILSAREQGPFESMVEFAKRIEPGSINKRTMEALVLGGAFDGLGDAHRSQLVAPSGKFETYYEAALKYGATYRREESNAQNSLFGMEESFTLPEPELLETRPWSLLEKVTKEKEILGLFLSGHPLDQYAMEIKHFTNVDLSHIEKHQGEIRAAGVVTTANERISGNTGTAYGQFELQDYSGSFSFNLYREQYSDLKNRLTKGQVVMIVGKNIMREGRDPFFKVKDVRLMDAVADVYCKGLLLGIHIDAINPSMIKKLESLLIEHQGPKAVKVSIEEPNEKHVLQLKTRKYKVHISTSLIQQLQALNIAYKIL